MYIALSPPPAWTDAPTHAVPADRPDGKPCPRRRIMPGPYCLEHDTADADHPLRWMIDEGVFCDHRLDVTEEQPAPAKKPHAWS